MNVDDIYPSKWLRCADLKGTAHQVTISDVDSGTIGEKQQIIISFRGDWKPLGLNKTNASTIADLYGSDTDEWIGEDIVIFPTRVDFQGKMVDAIRVDGRATQKLVQEKIRKSKAGKAPAKSASKPAPAVTQEEADEDVIPDDIPF